MGGEGGGRSVGPAGKGGKAPRLRALAGHPESFAFTPRVLRGYGRLHVGDTNSTGSDRAASWGVSTHSSQSASQLSEDCHAPGTGLHARRRHGSGHRGGFCLPGRLTFRVGISYYVITHTEERGKGRSDLICDSQGSFSEEAAIK